MYRAIVDDLRDKFSELLNDKDNIIVAIDGRCGSGKTTLAAEFQDKLNCNVIHMDDFFLRPEQRTPERYGEPGGNVDYERFSEEVISALLKSRDITYRPFDCKVMAFGDEINLSHNKITIIEGSYSLHPNLGDIYDLKLFLTIDYDTQISRIRMRNGEDRLSMFIEKWIPMEEKYFNVFNIEGESDVIIDTSN